MLLLLCGKAFAGKSTLAAQLASRLNCRFISLDSINLERGLVSGSGVEPEEWKLSFDIAKELVCAALTKGETIIVDDTLCYRFLRDDLRALATSANVACHLIFLDASDNLVKERQRANLTKGTRPHVDESVLDQHLATFEPPQQDENPILLSAEPSESEIDSLFKQLGAA